MILRAEFIDLQEPVSVTMNSVSQEFTVNGVESYSPPIQSVPWDHVTDKPDTFPPSEHTHPISEVDELAEILAGKANAADLANVAFSGEMNDLTTTTVAILYCGTSREVVGC